MDFTNLKKNLEKNGFKVSCFEAKEEASAYVNSIVDGKTVGFGGSITTDQMGLKDSLAEHNTIVSHWRIPEGKTRKEVLAESMLTDVYIASANGVAETGEIINIDGTGNRIASLIFGHDKVIYVIGKNKIAPTYDEALWRARNIAAPVNAKRLKRNTPCAVDGKCHDCCSPERICGTLTVTWKKGLGQDVEIVLINEDLGY